MERRSPGELSHTQKTYAYHPESVPGSGGEDQQCDAQEPQQIYSYTYPCNDGVNQQTF